MSGSTTLVRTGICLSAPLVAGDEGLVSDSTSFFTTTSETLLSPLTLLTSSFAEGASTSEATSLEFNAGDEDSDVAVDAGIPAILNYIVCLRTFLLSNKMIY